jgi:hypothetical protein
LAAADPFLFDGESFKLALKRLAVAQMLIVPAQLGIADLLAEARTHRATRTGLAVAAHFA